jgi:hypothetical protein
MKAKLLRTTKDIALLTGSAIAMVGLLYVAFEHPVEAILAIALIAGGL